MDDAALDRIDKGAMIPLSDLEAFRQLRREHKAQKLALAMIKKSVDRLYKSVQDRVYDARSTVGDETLNMLEEFKGLEDG